MVLLTRYILEYISTLGSNLKYLLTLHILKNLSDVHKLIC